ncbi:MAG: DUF1549 and DUF1553 domain-containing protein, partial [Chthoniobacteraceae bacterium]
VPKVADPKHFIQNPIDSFVLAKLAEKKLAPSAKADKQTLIRRVTYDLIGLPPTPEEVDAFLADNSTNAFEKVVDRLLASPRYGERWGRHWLDIARYADTSGDRQNGGKRNPLYPHAWTFRDYVIDAFNKDLPYDQFIVEQIAADKLPESKTEKSKLAALGFLTVGKRFMGNDNDVIDDRIDVVTKGVMGLTGSCARCHDHKFDPIPTKDYYSLYGVFTSSQDAADGVALNDPEKNPHYGEFKEAVAKVEKEIDQYRDTEAARLLSGMLEKSGDYMLVAHEAKATSSKGGKKNDNFRILARDKGLKAELAAIWLDRAKAIEAGKKDDAVFGPWVKFAELSADKFAESAPAFAKEIAASTTVTPAIAKAFATKAPASLKDVAAIYTEAFGTLHKQLKLDEFLGYKGGGRNRFDIAKTQVVLADADMEALRKQIFGTASAILPDEQNMTRALGNQFTTQQGAIRAKIVTLELVHPGAPVKAMSVTDRDKPRDAAVLVRGEPQNRGDIVPRQFPALLAPDRKPFTDGSGRLEMARLIASRDNPLTARVIVNRVWMWHFGQAIVRTVSDFGTRSEPPTHPELLDYLATWLMEKENGWSLKKLNKFIVMSAAYQQDSRPNDAAMKSDPTNQWLWRANVQRLDFEQVRDSLLSLGGKLDLTMGGQPFILAGSSIGGKGKYASADLGISKVSPNRRSVYAFLDRSALPEMLNTFDFANPDMSTGERIMTTVPQQALFMMNSPFLVEQVKNILSRPDFPAAASDAEKVRFIFRTAFQRQPTDAELKIAEKFLAPEAPQPKTAETSPVAIGQAEALEAKLRKKAAAGNAQMQPLNALERYTQIILLTNELIFLN